MSEKISVNGISLNNYNTHKAMEQIQGFFESGTMRVVYIPFMDVLKKSGGDELVKSELENADLTIPGDKEILESQENGYEERIKEIEDGIFISAFFEHIVTNGKKIYLLAQTSEINEEIRRYLMSNNENIQIAGTSALEEGVSSDVIVNDINGTDADLLLIWLPSPEQESFINENKGKLNVKICMGMGDYDKTLSFIRSKTKLIKRIIDGSIFKR